MKILLIIPPFTQLNTPYPSTAYLKPVLEKEGHEVKQIDLGIKTIARIFSIEGLNQIYQLIEKHNTNYEYASLQRFLALKNQYLETIEPVLAFLQGKNDATAYRIISGQWLPEGERQEYEIQSGMTFSDDSLIDKARHKATLYLEEIGDIISHFCDPLFGFSRYAEKQALSPKDYKVIEDVLEQEHSFTSKIFTTILKKILEDFNPELCGFSIPFPGNLISSLICSKYIKSLNKKIKITFGGGYVNTELRSLKSQAFFNYVDYLTVDDGETPLLQITKHINNLIDPKDLIRTFFLNDKKEVIFIDGKDSIDYIGDYHLAPDFSELMDHPYISILPVMNKMHRLWSEGKWNKMTLAHGCYWKRCAFCDTSLDYIKRYKPEKVEAILENIEKMAKETGIHSFHFVDEAAPPALLKNLAIGLIKKGLSINWWTNIRYEKSFSPDLCRLLAKSGCIAISGGLEVASDRLLKKIDKGVTVKQVASVTASFRSSGILVHAYLMYGFPGQKESEIIDALEMVRQLFKNGLIDSAFWHQFALTAHSPVGLNPQKYGIEITGPPKGDFAKNDLEFQSHEKYRANIYSSGLKTALASYMNKQNFEKPLKEWFNFKIPKSKIGKNYIKKMTEELYKSLTINDNSIFLWIGGKIEYREGCLYFFDIDASEKIKCEKNEADFLLKLSNLCNIKNNKIVKTNEVEKLSEEYSINLDRWFGSKIFYMCSSYGLLIL